MQSSSRRRNVRRSLVAAIALALVTPAAVPLAARANESAALVNNDAAHLSFVEGRVTIGRGTAGDGETAALDAPVLDADYVTTGARSRAELQFDGTERVRLGENVQLRVAHLNADGRDVQLAAGTIDVRLLQASDGGTAIDTPSVSVIPEDAGTYRITVDETGTTFVTVRAGHAEIETSHGARPLDAGSTLVAHGTASDPQISTRDAIAFDAFDTFDDQLDHQSTTAFAPPAGPPSYAPSNVAPSPGYAPIPSYAQPYATAYAPVYAPVYVPSYAYGPAYPYGYGYGSAYGYGYPRVAVRVSAGFGYGAPLRAWVTYGAGRGRPLR
jgi:hypothetical protein